MIEIVNNEQCFVQLWLRLERTRQLFGMQYRRFCIRRVMKSWMPTEATDEMIWEVCQQAATHEYETVYGLDVLPAPSLHPRKCREFLRALVAVKLGIGVRKVDLKALDRAYSIAFPHSTPINVNKKRRQSLHRESNENEDENDNCRPSRRQTTISSSQDDDSP